MKKVKTRDTEPEDMVPFVMQPAFLWELYDLGKVNAEKMMLYSVLSRHANPFNGYGKASYEQICIWLKLRPSKKEVNRITKLMKSMRDEYKLIWFRSHKGIRDFAYLVRGYKIGKKDDAQKDKWVDIDEYFDAKNQRSRITKGEAVAQPSSKATQNTPVENQRSGERNNGSMKSMSELMYQSQIRPPYTDTD